MSEDDQKMKALVETETETVTETSSSSVKNDDNKEKAAVIIQNLCDNKNVNMGLFLGGLYGASPPERVQNVVAEVAALPRPSSPSAATNPAGHEVLPERRLLVRPQFVPVRRRPARSNLRQCGRAIAQRKLQQILASTLNRGLVALSQVNGVPTAKMIMFQCIPGTSTNWNQRPAVPAGIKFHNSLASHSYAEPIPAGVELANPLVSNSVELSGTMLQNGPAPVLKGTTELIQNAAARLDSNGESAEFTGTNIENAPICFGSNRLLTEYAGTMVPNDGASGSSTVENEGGVDI